MKTLLKTFLAVFLAVLAGCASGGEKKAAVCPGWVNMGGDAMPDGAQYIYGVGMANNIGNIVLLRDTSDNRAIHKVASQVEVLSSSLMKDYMASTSASSSASGKSSGGSESSSGSSSETLASEEQAIESAIKTVVKQTLSGVRIADRCHDKEANIYYSLAKMPINSYKENFASQPGISKKMVDHIRENAEKLYGEMK